MTPHVGRGQAREPTVREPTVREPTAKEAKETQDP